MNLPTLLQIKQIPGSVVQFQCSRTPPPQPAPGTAHRPASPGPGAAPPSSLLTVQDKRPENVLSVGPGQPEPRLPSSFTQVHLSDGPLLFAWTGVSEEVVTLRESLPREKQTLTADLVLGFLLCYVRYKCHAPSRGPSTAAFLSFFFFCLIASPTAHGSHPSRGDDTAQKFWRICSQWVKSRPLESGRRAGHRQMFVL